MDALFHLTCPSCGARVPVLSSTSVLVVCEYCHSALLREGDSCSDSGRKSDVLEDYSPIQIHTSGVYKGIPFEVIGRIQLHYDRGFWNEWYILFSNGTCGWLSDSGWQYTITKLSLPLPTDFYDFCDISAGITRLNYDKNIFIASDVRSATSMKANAQGELPFTVSKNWEVHAADFRSGRRFLTLDYTDDPKTPIVYCGDSVTLHDLHCQMLRSKEQIIETAGRSKGTTVPFSCPNCGGSLQWYPGIASNIVCPNCHCDLDLSEGKAVLLGRHSMRLNQQKLASIKLGERAKIGGVSWTAIGMIRCQELDNTGETYNRNTDTQPPAYSDELLFQSVEWYEYLLYHPQHGFRWIIESDEGWELVKQISHWPNTDKDGNPVLSNKAFRRGYNYGSKVIYAAGAFYWRVLPGDITFISDYVHKNEKLSMERTKNELTWSRSITTPSDEVATWFKRPELARKKTFTDFSLPELGFINSIGINSLGTVFAILLVIINLPFFFILDFNDVLDPIFIGLLFILIPLSFTSGRNN